jgi:hypothetical protein
MILIDLNNRINRKFDNIDEPYRFLLFMTLIALLSINHLVFAIAALFIAVSRLIYFES